MREGGSCADLPFKGNSQCKVPEVRVCLVCLRKDMDAGVAGMDKPERESSRKEGQGADSKPDNAGFLACHKDITFTRKRGPIEGFEQRRDVICLLI